MPMKCVNPECTNENIIARGYCSACYHRLRKRGTLTRSYVVNAGKCSTEGCGEPSFAKNLCSRHYYEAENPLKQPWKNLRTRYKGQFPPEWDKFESFLADVSKLIKPEGECQLRRIRQNEPWSIFNMHWIKVLGVPDDRRRGYLSEYGKVWSDEKKYGVSAERRAQMTLEQNGCCAICRKPESVANPRHPERAPRRLSIDHDRRTGQVRGLLCGRCNTMIGRRGADDSIIVLRAAIAYLERHAVFPLDIESATG